MTPELVLWIYIGLLVIGGVIGFAKAKSAVSLVTALVFGTLLAIANLHLVEIPHLADVLLALLLVVFAMRFGKTRKFMPAGMLLVVTFLALALRFIPL